MKRRLPFLLLFATLSMPFLTMADGYNISVSTNTPYAGQQIKVSWTTPRYANTYHDWIGLYPEGRPLEVVRIFLLSNFSGNNVTIRINSPGNWAVQYFQRDSYVALSAATVFSVRDSANMYNFAVTTNRVAVGQQVAVSWQTLSIFDTINDFVGWYDTTNPTVLLGLAPVEGRMTGTVYFPVDHPSVYGARYLKSGSSITNAITPELRVTASAPLMYLSIRPVGNDVEVSWYGFGKATYRLVTSSDLSIPKTNWVEVRQLRGTNTVVRVRVHKVGATGYYSVQETW